MELRKYQSDLIDRVRQSFASGKRAPLLVAPTGSGKTVMFSAFAKAALGRQKRILILAHRAELLDQISRTLHQFNVGHFFIAPGRAFQPRAFVQVGSVFSVAKRLKYLVAPDLIIIDEAHHTTLKSTWGRVIQAFPSAYRIGVTATPARLSGEALGDLFDDLIVGPTISELIAQGALAPYRIWAPPTINTDGIATRGGDFARDELAAMADKSSITGDVVKHYLKHAAGKRAIGFCVSRDHAKHAAQQFSAAGISSVSIDGSMPSDQRALILKNYLDGIIQVLMSCDLVSEGYDLPAIECAILLRPTKSTTLFLQQVGRALRPYPGKEHAIILDHAGNCMRHGLPDEERAWSLEGRLKSGSDEPRVSVRMCPQCFGVNPGNVRECAYCKYVFLVIARDVEQREGNLEEVTGQLLLKLKEKRKQGMANSYADLVALGRERKYKRPEAWAAVIMQARKNKKFKGAH